MGFGALVGPYGIAGLYALLGGCALYPLREPFAARVERLTRSAAFEGEVAADPAALDIPIMFPRIGEA